MRLCKECGQELPEFSKNTRKYCIECAPNVAKRACEEWRKKNNKRVNEMQRIRNKKGFVGQAELDRFYSKAEKEAKEWRESQNIYKLSKMITDKYFVDEVLE